MLLAVFGLALVRPALALGKDAENGLHACCRRNGKHHCAMAGERGESATQTPLFRAAVEKCPFCPAALTAAHAGSSAVPAAPKVFAESVSHPTGVVQTECKRRISQDRSRQKRGPPGLSLS